MSVLKALSTHLSFTQQTAFHLEVGCKSNHICKDLTKQGFLSVSLKDGFSLKLGKLQKTANQKKSVASALCAQAERCLPLWSGQEKAARWWRCGNSRGVIFYVGMKCICTLHSAHTAKHIAIDTGHTTVCTNSTHRESYTYMAHTYKARQQQGAQTQLFAQHKVSQPQASQNLL